MRTMLGLYKNNDITQIANPHPKESVGLKRKNIALKTIVISIDEAVTKTCTMLWAEEVHRAL